MVLFLFFVFMFVFFKQKTAYDMRISDWSSDVCSSDLAYYHFWLMRMYGPIPLVRENLPITAGLDEVRVHRDSFDECVDYVVELIDSATMYLPDRIENESSDRGRITRSIALSIKASDRKSTRLNSSH